MNDKEVVNENEDEEIIDFGYTTAISGFAAAVILIIVMFATSGRV